MRPPEAASWSAGRRPGAASRSPAVTSGSRRPRSSSCTIHPTGSERIDVLDVDHEYASVVLRPRRRRATARAVAACASLLELRLRCRRARLREHVEDRRAALVQRPERGDSARRSRAAGCAGRRGPSGTSCSALDGCGRSTVSCLPASGCGRRCTSWCRRRARRASAAVLREQPRPGLACARWSGRRRAAAADAGEREKPGSDEKGAHARHGSRAVLGRCQISAVRERLVP